MAKKAEKKKLRREDRPAVSKWGSISLTGGFAVWAVVWFIGLLSTQLLRSSASNIFFRFIGILPIASLIYALIGKAALKVYMTSDTATTEKMAPMTYEFRIFNESFLPYPFVDAYMMLPQTDSVRCTERLVKVSVPPLSDYNVKNTVHFRFRGTYEIGVSCFYVYDFFRMFRIKVAQESYETVYVLPRRLVMEDDSTQNVSDSTRQSRKNRNSYEKIEVSDIRDYRPGDPIKSIHWKLSSKNENVIIREYNAGTTDMTYIFADLSARFPQTPPDRGFDLEKKKKKAKKETAAPEETAEPAVDVAELINDEAYADMNEYCADGVVELAVASVLRELRSGRRVNLMWFDSRAEIGAYSFELHSAAEFDSVFKLFATAPLAPAEKTVAKLSAMVSESEDAKYVIVLPTIDDDTVASLCTMPCLSDSSGAEENEAVVFTDDERYAHKARRAAYIEGCARQLAECGLTLIRGSLEGFTEQPSQTTGKEDAAHAG